jgi:hypothetical protein
MGNEVAVGNRPAYGVIMLSYVWGCWGNIRIGIVGSLALGRGIQCDLRGGELSSRPSFY